MKNKKFKKIIIIILLIILLIPIVSILSTGIVYNSIFNRRYEVSDNYNYQINDFEGLQRKKYNYESNENQTLTGYLYSYSNDDEYLGIIVLVHGLGGGGHIPYMECIYYFVQNNYLVFGYDATGNGESEGKITGLPQQLLDLSYTIYFINNEINSTLPMLLFGHSWGGYAVCNVLNIYPEIKGVVSIAGFDNSTDMIYEYGAKNIWLLGTMMMPFITRHEKKLFGEYASYSGIIGLKNSNCKAMIIHSEDDETVPIKYGYDLYYEEFKNDSRFTFVKYNDKGHSTVFYSYEAIDRSKNNNDKLFDLIDLQLFEGIINFYNESI